MEYHVCDNKCNDHKNHVRAEDVNLDDKVYIHAGELGYKDVIIQTTHREIMEALEVPVSECKKMMPIARKMFQNKNIESMYATKDKEWINFCNDIVLYYVYRFKVHGKLIPICELGCKPIENDMD